VHVGEHDVGLVLLADEVDPDQPAHRAVRAVGADHVRGPLRAGGRLHGHAVAVLADAGDLDAVRDLHAQFGGPLLQQEFGAALRRDQDHRVPGGQRAQVGDGTRRGYQLADRDAARHQVVGQAAGVEQFESTGVYGERPGDVGLVRAPFQHPGTGTGQREFGGEHQTGRPGADHDHVDGCHAIEGRGIRPASNPRSHQPRTIGACSTAASGSPPGSTRCSPPPGSSAAAPW
jgi:hypothetical protein